MPPKEKVGRGGRGNNKRPRASITESRPPPKEDMFMGLTRLTVDHKNKWRNLVKPKRALQITRFLNVGVLQELGMEELVRKLMRNTGLEAFLGKSAPVYKRVTLEFLSTLERIEDNGVRGIRFHLNDTVRTMSYDLIRTVFGVQEAVGEVLEKDQLAEFFYFDLTGKPLRKAYLNTNSLTHPVWRMFYRGISMTFLGNGEPTRMNYFHVSLMQTALPTNAVIPDWVELFIRRCESFSTRPSGNIPVGGLITLLALHFVKSPLDAAVKLGGPYFFNHSFLVKHDGYETVLREYDALTFVYGGGRTFHCCRGAVYPEGPRARDWRMHGVVDWFSVEVPEIEENHDEEREEEQGGDDEEMPDQDDVEAQQSLQQDISSSVDNWGQMRSFIESQQQSTTSMLRHHFEEIYDRIEAVEDEVALIRRTQIQTVHWMQQAEPRQYEPVPETYEERLRSRADDRERRRAARRAYFDGASSSHQ